MATKRKTRQRRSATEARVAILDAAERRLIESGPAGIRIQAVAADVGVSHPTVLHHFGSREALVEAVVARAFAALDADVLRALIEVAPEEGAVEVLLNRVLEALTRGGHARALAWLALSHYKSPHPGGLDVLVDAVHARRIEACRVAKRARPSREDSAFTVVLASHVLIGEALLGSMLSEAFARDGANLGARFRAWFGRLLIERLDK